MKLRKCPVCGGKLRSEALGWICYDCQGFIDMQGVFHEHKEKPFMPPQTNADHIRAMSDEELADWLGLTITDTVWNEFGKRGISFSRKVGLDAFNQMLEWLKQPAEGE